MGGGGGGGNSVGTPELLEVSKLRLNETILGKRRWAWLTSAPDHAPHDVLLFIFYYYYGFTVRYSVLVTGTENADIKMRYLLKAGLYVLQNARLCTCIVTINILLYNQ